MGRYRRKSSYTPNERFRGKHRFEHWYVDNQIYFITARCANKFPAFSSDEAKAIFWDRFDYYTRQYEFTPAITALLNTHYHTLGYLKIGTSLGPMMRKIHGSVAKLVNDTLDERLVPFWHDQSHRDYFDGCIRNEKQCRLAYRYVFTQYQRIHRTTAAGNNVRVAVSLDLVLKRARELNAFMEGIPYPRYGQC